MNILILSNSPNRNYGYSVVADRVAVGLQKADHQVHFLGMQTISAPYADKEGIINLGIKYDPWAGDILADYLRTYHIDCFLSIMDIWLGQTNYIGPLMKQRNVCWVAHVTVTSAPLSPFLAAPMSQANFIIAPSKFVYNEIVNAGFRGDVYHISHGVDLNIFKPLSDEVKEEMKKRLRVEDKEFILLTVMRNKSPFQKDYPALFHAWKTMLENHPELKTKGILICLTDPLEPSGLRLDILRDRVGLKDFVKFIWLKPTKDLSAIEATYEGDQNGFCHTANLNFPQEEMAKIYNIADAYVQASFGESFALPVLESMACGIPQVNVNHSTGPELVGESKAGLLADVKANLTTPLISDSWLTDPESLANCIERMYLDKEFRKRCSENGLNFVKKYDWKNITSRWCDLVGAIPYLS